MGAQYPWDAQPGGFGASERSPKFLTHTVIPPLLSRESRSTWYQSWYPGASLRLVPGTPSCRKPASEAGFWLVGAARFELATFRPPAERATKLRHAPGTPKSKAVPSDPDGNICSMAEGQRRCGRCGEMKPLDDFAWRRKAKGQRHNMCRPCHAEYHRGHYLANKQRYIDQAAAQKRRARLARTLFLVEYFKEHPCVDCGETDPVVLEFDHRGEKSFEVTRKFAERSWQSILDEIEKCEVRCANCHRRRTAMQRSALRYMLVQPAA
jgi:predicted RNA-binding protein YlxR (DUF448 family)